jgi:hypothetical protein
MCGQLLYVAWCAVAKVFSVGAAGQQPQQQEQEAAPPAPFGEYGRLAGSRCVSVIFMREEQRGVTKLLSLQCADSCCTLLGVLWLDVLWLNFFLRGQLASSRSSRSRRQCHRHPSVSLDSWLAADVLYYMFVREGQREGSLMYIAWCAVAEFYLLADNFSKVMTFVSCSLRFWPFAHHRFPCCCCVSALQSLLPERQQQGQSG